MNSMASASQNDAPEAKECGRARAFADGAEYLAQFARALTELDRALEFLPGYPHKPLLSMALGMKQEDRKRMELVCDVWANILTLAVADLEKHKRNERRAVTRF